MRFFLEYPLQSEQDPAWIDPANIVEFARVAEASGIDGIAFTDHPAPSRKWLDRGGHETIEPFVGLGFLAAATSTIRLMTQLTVVPYRNPLLLAKEMTTVDILSGGRATFAMGTGYLRSEFAALGVDFEERNALFDEAIAVMKGLWANPRDFHHEGRHFAALGVTLQPAQVQQPHPPLWLGGNAKVVRDRVAAWGDGWAPMVGSSSTLMRTTRTPGIETEAELVSHLTSIRDAMAESGRDPDLLDVACGSPERLPADASIDQQVDSFGRMEAIGITWTGAPVDRSSVPAALDSMRAFGDVIAKLR